MGRQEGSPLFAESIANYDSRRLRGRKKILIGVITVGVAVLLTLAIAIPLSTDNSIDTNSSSIIVGSLPQSQEIKDFEEDEGEADDGEDYKEIPAEENQEEGPLKSFWSSRRRRTKRPHHPSHPTRSPPTSTTTEAGKEEDEDEDDRHGKFTRKRRTTENPDSFEDNEEYEDVEGRPWRPRPRTRRPWWPWTTKKDDHCDDDSEKPRHPTDHTRRPWYPTDHTRRPWYPTDHTKRPWYPTDHTRKPWYPTDHTRRPKTPESTTTHSTTQSPESTTTETRTSKHPRKTKCQKLSEDQALSVQLDDYANIWWHELIRVQSAEVPIPLKLIGCSKGYFRVKVSGGFYTPEDARAIYKYNDNKGNNETISLELRPTEFLTQWLEISDDEEIQLSIVSRANDTLLTYECLPSKFRAAEYVIRVWSLEPKETPDATALSLLDLAISLGLNPEELIYREIDQTNC